jgi:hypothetical protein
MKKERRQKAQSSKQQEPELYCLLPSAFCFLLFHPSSLRRPARLRQPVLTRLVYSSVIDYVRGHFVGDARPAIGRVLEVFG